MSIVNLSLYQEEATLSGELTRQTIAMIDDKTVVSLLEKSQMVLSLDKVSKIDTAGLAWLFELLERAQSKHCTLTFAALPEKLNKLIALSGVEGFLPLATSSTTK